MKVQSLQDLAKRVDTFPMTWLYEGKLIEKDLLRESPKNSELAHYLNVLRKIREGMLLVKTDIQRAKWMKDVKDDLFLYFCAENAWLSRDMLDPVQAPKVQEIIEKIASVVADLAEEDSKQKKKLELWDTWAGGLKKYLQVTNKSLVDFLDERYYRFIQELEIRSTPTTEEEYKESNKVTVMDIKDLLPF